MALTITVNDVNVQGDQKHVYATVAFDNSYPTGGEIVTPSLFAGTLTQVDDAILINSISLAVARFVGWNRVTKALRLYTALGVEAGNGTDQSTVNDVRVVFVGK